MGRPAIDEDKKRRAVSVSLRPDILAMADASGNKSQFLERSVEACHGILELMNELREGSAKKSDVLEEIEDIVDAWGSLTEESMPLKR